MRHGRLASAFAIAVGGLAAAQSPPLTPYNPLPPAVVSGTVRTEPVQVNGTPADPKAAPAADATPAPAPRVVGTPGGAPIVTTSPQSTPACCSPVTTLPPTAVGGPVVADGGWYGAGGGQFWASIEYLAWRIKEDRVPPLVTTGPATFPVGFLGNPGTIILSDPDLDPGTFSGVRLRVGAWLDPCRTFGVELGFFALEEREERDVFNNPVLARPFTDVNTGNPNSEFLAFPGIATGSAVIENQTKLCGVNLLGRKNMCMDCWSRLDLLFGVQYLNLEEELTITETPTFAPTAPFPGLAGVSFVAADRFRTRNQFYGALVGFEAAAWEGPFFVELMGTFAVGTNRQRIEIDGFQRATAPDGTVTVFRGGLLALPGANIGDHTNSETSTVTTVGINLGYQLSPNVAVFGGYTFLYWTNVVRPGQQIDPVLDINRIPNFGTAPPAATVRPRVPFEQDDFWAQGVNLGVRLSW